ncbi:fibronectin type III domain-containing protein [Streptomyces crystallinus]|uniref:Fibronectin type III domain-containing protein n=1 Tax=Streptomyces crystallinus TaxID=68191 RepID=A0ABP3S6M2_9ACTN
MPALRSTSLRAVLTGVLAALVLGGPGLVPSAGAGAGPRTADVYVSPSGMDAADGTAGRPVRTLTRARDLARDKAAHYGSARYSGDITVHLAAGTYRTAGPLVLDGRDSGPAGHRIVWQGAGAESTLISGGRRVEGWRPVAGRPGLWSAPASQGLTDTRQLYVDGVRAQRARGEVPTGLSVTATGYTATTDALARWRRPSDAEFVYTGGEALWNVERDGLGQWTEPRCRVASARGTAITMVQPCWDNSNKRVEFPDRPGRTVSMVGPGRLTNGGRPSYVENAYELLDQPGEWYLDRSAHTVYYLPRAGEDLSRADVEAAAAEKLVDGRGTRAAPLHDIAFQGVQFAYATWLTPSGPEGFSEIQAGYTLTGPKGWATQGLCGFVEGGTCPFASWTKMPGNVSFAYGQRIGISDCVFAHLGAAGLDLGAGTTDSAVRGSVFTDISGNGLEVGGVDGQPVARGVEVADNHLYGLPREYHGGVGILDGYTQHTTIAHNQLDHLGYSAISLGWGGWPDKIGSPATPNPSHDNVVRDNLIFDYMQLLDDGGGVYTQGLTGTSMDDGELVTGNVIHGQWGLGKSVYTDNGCTYETVRGNVLYGAAYANVGSRHTDYRDGLGNNDPTLIEGNWWEEGAGDSTNKGLVTRGNHIMAGSADVPPEVVARAGIEPAYRGVLDRRVGAVSVPEAPARVGVSTGGRDGLYVTFNPSFVDGGSPVTGYTAYALRADGTEAGRAEVDAGEFGRTGVMRVGQLTAADGPLLVVVTARNAYGESARSLASAPVAPVAASVLPGAPTGAKLRVSARAVTVAWTPPAAVGDAEVVGYRVTVSDGRVVSVAGRDVLVTRASGKGVFRVVGGLTPGTSYSVTVAAVTAAGVGPAVAVTGTTPFG